MTVTLPTDPAARKQVFGIREAMDKKLGLKPEMVQVEVGGREGEDLKHEPLKDWGQRLLPIRLVKGYDIDAVLNGTAAMDEDDDEGANQPKAAITPREPEPPPADAPMPAPLPGAQPSPAELPY